MTGEGGGRGAMTFFYCCCFVFCLFTSPIHTVQPNEPEVTCVPTVLYQLLSIVQSLFGGGGGGGRGRGWGGT